jgi:hypothetical protein
MDTCVPLGLFLLEKSVFFIYSLWKLIIEEITVNKEDARQIRERAI